MYAINIITQILHFHHSHYFLKQDKVLWYSAIVMKHKTINRPQWSNNYSIILYNTHSKHNVGQ